MTEDVGFEWNYNRIQYWQDPGLLYFCNNPFNRQYPPSFYLHRPAGASGTRVGHKDASDSKQEILFRCETKPQGKIYQGG